MAIYAQYAWLQAYSYLGLLHFVCELCPCGLARCITKLVDCCEIVVSHQYYIQQRTYAVFQLTMSYIYMYVHHDIELSTIFVNIVFL